MVYNDAWAIFYPDRMKAQRHYLGKRMDQEKSFEVVQISPEGGIPFEVWVNPANHLIERAIFTQGTDRHMQVFADFRNIQGLRLPFSLKTFDLKSGKEEDSSTITNVQINTTLADSAFQAPKSGS